MSTAPEPTNSARARRRRVRCLAGSVALAATLVVVDGVAVEAGTPAQVLALSPTADSVIGLHYGSYGDSVRELQRALIRVGVGVVGGVDGYFGSATRASVRASIDSARSEKRRSTSGRVTSPFSIRNVPSRVTPVRSVSFGRTTLTYQTRVT